MSALLSMLFVLHVTVQKARHLESRSRQRADILDTVSPSTAVRYTKHGAQLSQICDPAVRVPCSIPRPRWTPVGSPNSNSGRSRPAPCSGRTEEHCLHPDRRSRLAIRLSGVHAFASETYWKERNLLQEPLHNYCNLLSVARRVVDWQTAAQH